jgi:cell division protein FtsB
MSTKVITVWLILLTAWVGFNDIARHRNLQVRQSNTANRNQRFENIEANLKSLDANLKSLEQFINGPLRDKVNEIGKYLQEH